MIGEGEMGLMGKEKDSNKYLVLLIVIALVLSLNGNVLAESKNEGWTVTKYWEKYKNFPQDPNFFPIMVWLQAPSNAAKYKAAWMLLDEPDNWQFKAPITMAGKTWKYGPKPSRVSAKDLNEMYMAVKSNDPTRPIMSGFSCGVAIDDYKGRGSGWNNSMYPEYMKSNDFVGFDVYPTSSVGDDALWFQGKGLDRIKEWAGAEKPRFNAIGPCYTGSKRKPRPEETKFEVWCSIIHGTKAILYFAHNISPFVEDALLRDSAQLENITKINVQIKELAPVINGPEYNGATVDSSVRSIPIDIMVKKYKEETYIFSAAARMGGKTTGTFEVKDVNTAGKVEVLGENRTLDIDAKGKFKDEFGKWQVHIYKVNKKY